MSVESKLRQIDEILLKEIVGGSKISDISLCGGVSGISLFFYYRYRLSSEEKYLEAGNALLKTVIENIQSCIRTPYCGGIAGVGWLIEHLAKEDFIDFDDEILREMDDSLLQCMDNDLHYKYYDFLHGAIGYGYYFLSRKKSKLRTRALWNLVDKLNEIAVIEDDQVRWNDFVYESQGNKPKRSKHVIDENKFNLGLSHGIPSITAFLAKVVNEGINQNVARHLLEGSINFLLTVQINNPEISIYPYAVNKLDFQEGLKGSRLGWCYGDLGVATALHIAGKALHSKKIIEEANRIMVFSAKRQNIPINRIKDCGLCHGSSGVAQIFTRFYWETKNPLFKTSAEYWVDQSLKMAVHDDGIAGFKRWSGDEGHTLDFGLLEGSAGIGLALLSSLSDEPLPWDECLLIS